MDYYLGEIRIFAGKYAPEDWNLCDGSTLSVSANEALFSLLGTSWGGDGVNNFQLPDLRGRLPVGQGQGTNLSNYTLGGKGGQDSVTLLPDNLPPHTHVFNATTANATTVTIGNTVTYAKPTDGLLPYVLTNATPAPAIVGFNGAAIAHSGGSQPHANVMPELALNYIICVKGLYPEKP